MDDGFSFLVSSIFYLLILLNTASGLEWQKRQRFDDLRFPGEFLISS